MGRRSRSLWLLENQIAVSVVNRRISAASRVKRLTSFAAVDLGLAAVASRPLDSAPA
nr:hypothetical protein [Micromonospora endophytica]